MSRVRGLFSKCGDDGSDHGGALLGFFGQRRVSAIPFDFKRQHSGQMLFGGPFATLLDRLTDQPEHASGASSVSVKLNPKVSTVLVLLGPNAMVAAGKPMDGLCDLD